MTNAEKILEALASGPKTAGELANECHIPLTGRYGGIYALLHRLEETGWIVRYDGPVYTWGLVEDDA